MEISNSNNIIAGFNLLADNFEKIKKLVTDLISIENFIESDYKLSGIILLDESKHFTLIIKNLRIHIKDLSLGKDYYYDGTKNGGIIIPINNYKDYINSKRIPYIVIYSLK